MKPFFRFLVISLIVFVILFVLSVYVSPNMPNGAEGTAGEASVELGWTIMIGTSLLAGLVINVLLHIHDEVSNIRRSIEELVQKLKDKTE